MGFIAAITPQFWLLYNVRFNPKVKDSVAWEDWEWVTIFGSVGIFIILAFFLPGVSSDGRVLIVLLCNIFGWMGIVGVLIDSKSTFKNRDRNQVGEEYR
jgi:hypothetical protein